MAKDPWVEAASANDSLVAEILVQMHRSSSSVPVKTTTKSSTLLPVSIGWGNRKNRSKSAAPTTAVSNGFGKEHRGSPTTHLSWSGGGGSTSDGSDESSRQLDLSSAGRSVKANEVASTSKSQKRKPFNRLKEGEQELASTRPNLNQEKSSIANLKRTKIDFDQSPIGKTIGSQSRRLIEEQETKRGFELPDLNMTPEEEELGTTMS